MFIVGRQITSRVKSSARKLRDVRPKCIQLEEIKDGENTSAKKIEVRLPLNRLREVIDFFFWSGTSFPAIKISSNSWKLAFGKYSTLNRLRDIDIVLADLRNFHRGNRPIVPIKTPPSARNRLLNRPFFTRLTPRFHSVAAINCARRKLSLKLAKRGADKNQEPAKSRRELSSTSREVFKDRCESDVKEDLNAEYLRSIQRASPSYSNKPGVYSAKFFPDDPPQKSTEPNSEDRKKSAGNDKVSMERREDRKKSTETDFEQQRRSNARTTSQSDKVYDRSCDRNDRRSRDTVEEKRTRVLSNVDRIIACVQRHTSYGTVWSFLSKKSKRTPKSIESHEDAYDGSSEELRPDPSPPKSVHWSETTKRSQTSLSGRPSPIVFAPHKPRAESSRKKREAEGSSSLVRKVNDNVSKRNGCLPRRTRYENGDKKCFSSRKYAKSRNFVAYTGGRWKEPLRMGIVKDDDVKNDSKETRRIPMDCKLHKIGETESLKKSRVETYLPRRERREGFEGSGEWKRQQYQVRLKIFKSKNGLDPCPPVTIRAQRLGDRFSPEEIKKPEG